MVQYPHAAASTPPGARALRVLVADDGHSNQVVALLALRHLGHTGMLVNDGEQALRCLAQHRFDLILMDDYMPHMDGPQAIAALRAGEAQGKPHVPVIMVTANDLPGDAERYRAAGADGYLPKPLVVEALQTEIARVLGLLLPPAMASVRRTRAASTPT